MTTFLALQNTYSHIEMGIFKDHDPLRIITIDKKDASRESISALESLLRSCSQDFSDLNFIAVNQGPGPFTTLRVVIATVNGLSFGKKIPLAGINSLEAFMQEYANQGYEHVVALLNAFSHDLYFGIQSNMFTETGFGSTAHCVTEISQKISHGSILFLGNGVDQMRDTLVTTFGNRAAFLSPNPLTVSLGQVAKMGLEAWENTQAIHYSLQPLYYKPATPFQK